MPLTVAQLKTIAPSMTASRIDTFLGPINDAMMKFNINTPAAQAMFLAQIMHESCACYYTKELASGQAYEGRKDLGNSQPGDGVRYKGRGLIQITGRANYAAVTMALDIDVLSNPELLEAPENAALSAGWFWSTHGLTELASANTADAFEKVTRRINGGINGLVDRQAYWGRAKIALGVK
ncbi:MAG: putative chitinase [Mucilaginibacter sp.]|nr:putative chitinase [Mucilaginibacter sp.]